jgi:hypothetical protein
LEFAMNDVVERILNAYQTMLLMLSELPIQGKKSADILKASRQLAEQLAIYGFAYLTELHEGQDPRFSGC